MRIPVPKERIELLNVFSRFLRTDTETGKATLVENAPIEAQKAFEKYMKLIEAIEE